MRDPNLKHAPDYAKTGEWLATVTAENGRTYTFRIVCDKQTTFCPGWKVADRHLPVEGRWGSQSPLEFLGDNRTEAMVTLAENAPRLKNPIKPRKR